MGKVFCKCYLRLQIVWKRRNLSKKIYFKKTIVFDKKTDCWPELQRFFIPKVEFKNRFGTVRITKCNKSNSAVKIMQVTRLRLLWKQAVVRCGEQKWKVLSLKKNLKYNSETKLLLQSMVDTKSTSRKKCVFVSS